VARATLAAQGYVAHIKYRGEEAAAKRRDPRKRARRWVVEACHSWLNRFRKLLVRFEKKAANYAALLEFACAIICWRRAGVLG
jgi:putative transposase